MPVLVGNGEQVIFPSCNGVNTSAPELLLYLITSLAVQRFGLDMPDPPLSVHKALETVLAAGATAEDPLVLTFLLLAFFAPLILGSFMCDPQESQEQQEEQHPAQHPAQLQADKHESVQEAQALHAMQNSFMVAHS